MNILVSVAEVNVTILIIIIIFFIIVLAVGLTSAVVVFEMEKYKMISSSTPERCIINKEKSHQKKILDKFLHSSTSRSRRMNSNNNKRL